MLVVAVGWEMYGITNSALALGLVGLAQFVPLVALVLVTGHVVDRFDRRRIAIVAEITMALGTAALLALTLRHALTPLAIYAIVIVIGAARAFEAPVYQTLINALATPDMVSIATARSSAANQTAIVVGPLLAGLLYALSPVAVLAVVAALFLTAVTLMASLRLVHPPATKEPPTLRSLFAGIATIRNRPVLLGAISLDLFAVLLGGATALLPIYARDILHTGPWGLGALRSAPAVGALAVSALLSARPLQHHIGRTLFAAVAAFGLATIGFGISHSFIVSLVMLVLLGASDVYSVVIRLTVVQRRTPDALLGRVSAVNTVFIGTSNQLGEFESGLTAEWLGPIRAVVLGGIGTLAIAALWMRLFPDLAKADTMEGHDADMRALRVE
jgi:MFS family permease